MSCNNKASPCLAVSSAVSVAAASFLLAACGDARESVSDVQWHTGSSGLRGHEDITRFGVKIANKNIGRHLFPDVSAGDSGSSSGNPLVKGNFETDFPSSFMLTYYANPTDWHNAPDLQSLHFLRNFGGDKMLSLRDACHGSLERMARASASAVSLWNADNKKRAFYFLGHVTHIIQDSFSEAHARRSGRRIKDICTFGKSVSGICYHPAVTDDDRVWDNDVSCQLNPSDRSWECLKVEAQHAAAATAGYLEAMAKVLESNAPLAPTLQTYFTSKDVRNGGYFDCEN